MVRKRTRWGNQGLTYPKRELAIHKPPRGLPRCYKVCCYLNSRYGCTISGCKRIKA